MEFPYVANAFICHIVFSSENGRQVAELSYRVLAGHTPHTKRAVDACTIAISKWANIDGEG